MKEIDSILAARRTEPARMRGAVLATVVHVQGSAYRRPGARMLILRDGSRIGTVSGGCLEADVSRKAWWFTEGGQPSVRAYDTTSDDDAVWEFGLGCNGVVHVLFEPVERAETSAMLDFIELNRRTGRGAAIATVVSTGRGSALHAGDRLFVSGDGTRSGALSGSAWEAAVARCAFDCMLAQQSCLAHLAGCDVFVEWVAPPVPLVIFGAGHDAAPLVRFAKELGWHVTVADGRPAFARPDRFPEADRVALVSHDDILSGIAIGRSSAVVLMTHNYPIDAKLAERILPLKPRYLGLLGPRSRAERLLREIGQPAHGVDVHAPVGLDLGGDTPESIALSIVAEIQASLNGRSGGPLRVRHGSIHDPVTESGRAVETATVLPERAVCELA